MANIPAFLKDNSSNAGDQIFSMFVGGGLWYPLPNFKFEPGTLYPERETTAHRAPESFRIVYSGDGYRKAEPLNLESGIILGSGFRDAINQIQTIEGVLPNATKVRWGSVSGSILSWDLQQGASMIKGEEIKSLSGNLMMIKMSFARQHIQPNFL
jgi:hypothetical protein